METRRQEERHPLSSDSPDGVSTLNIGDFARSTHSNMPISLPLSGWKDFID